MAEETILVKDVCTRGVPGSPADRLRRALDLLHGAVEETVMKATEPAKLGSVTEKRFDAMTRCMMEINTMRQLARGSLQEMLAATEMNASHEYVSHAKLRSLFFRTDKYPEIAGYWWAAVARLKWLARMVRDPDLAMVRFYDKEDQVVVRFPEKGNKRIRHVKAMNLATDPIQ